MWRFSGMTRVVRLECPRSLCPTQFDNMVYVVWCLFRENIVWLWTFMPFKVFIPNRLFFHTESFYQTTDSQVVKPMTIEQCNGRPNIFADTNYPDSQVLLLHRCKTPRAYCFSPILSIRFRLLLLSSFITVGTYLAFILFPFFKGDRRKFLLYLTLTHLKTLKL